MQLDDRSCLHQVLNWSRERDFRGHSKHDALNSPCLQALTRNRKMLRLAATQAVMRAPVNVRSLLGIPRLRNPKGVALFAHAIFDLAEQSEEEERTEWITLATELLAWLIQFPSPWTACPADLAAQFEQVEDSGGQADGPESPGLNGLGWGYHYPWQDAGFFQQRHFPNRVVSSWIGFSFIRGYEVTGETRFLDAARAITRFLLENPNRLVDSDDQLCLSYLPLDQVNIAVMDVSILTAALCAMVGKYDGDTALMETTHRLTRFVAEKQTDDGAWFYTWPKGDSHITHDNYHTGIILDCFADVMHYTEDSRYLDHYRAGLDYYRQQLFLRNGAPKWRHNRTYPHDIHGCASGILCFSRAAAFESQSGEPERATRHLQQSDLIRDWTLEHMYANEGAFFYQKSALLTKRFNLMRWNNAWMCRALAQRLRWSANTLTE